MLYIQFSSHEKFEQHLTNMTHEISLRRLIKRKGCKTVEESNTQGESPYGPGGKGRDAIGRPLGIRSRFKTIGFSP